MSKKYELIDSEFVFNFLGKKLFRIRTLIDIKFYGVKAGEKGGYVESERNLDQDGDAWVSGAAQVYGAARVYGDAWVSGAAEITKFHQSVSVSNLKWSMTSLPKGIQVGCQFMSLKAWKENHVAIGKDHGFTEAESKAYYELMKSVRKIQRLSALKLKEIK